MVVESASGVVLTSKLTAADAVIATRVAIMDSNKCFIVFFFVFYFLGICQCGWLHLKKKTASYGAAKTSHFVAVEVNPQVVVATA